MEQGSVPYRYACGRFGGIIAALNMEKRMIVRPCYKYTVISFACMIIFIIICKQSVLSRYIPMLSCAC